MADHSRSPPQDLLHILGFGSICRACRSLFLRCYPDKQSSFNKKTGNKTNPKSIEEHVKVTGDGNQDHPTNRNSDTDNMQEIHDPSHISLARPRDSFNRRSCDEYMIRSPQWSPPVTSTSTAASHVLRMASHGGPSPFSRSTRRRSQATMPPATATASSLGSVSQRNSVEATSATIPRTFSRSISRTGSTHILYSNSHGIIKPPEMEQQLDCSLDELCFGCTKKMKITREAITDTGQIVEEDEVLKIKVKPGWRKGTKIAFEGRSETPGVLPADVRFVVAEKKHPLFRRQEDDLLLEIEIPLVDALTGCTLSVPLLGRQTMSLTIDDIVHPGYEKIIAGQGMPKQNEPGTRGNLLIRFSVKFPEDLSEQHRSDAANILHQTS